MEEFFTEVVKRMVEEETHEIAVTIENASAALTFKITLVDGENKDD